MFWHHSKCLAGFNPFQSLSFSVLTTTSNHSSSSQPAKRLRKRNYEELIQKPLIDKKNAKNNSRIWAMCRPGLESATDSERLALSLRTMDHHQVEVADTAGQKWWVFRISSQLTLEEFYYVLPWLRVPPTVGNGYFTYIYTHIYIYISLAQKERPSSRDWVDSYLVPSTYYTVIHSKTCINLNEY